MTRSRKKYASHGFASGSNAQWKRDVRRLWRTRNRRLLRSLLKGRIHPDELQMLDKAYHNSDRWDEPTDGRVVIFQPGGRYTHEMIKRLKKEMNMDNCVALIVPNDWFNSSIPRHGEYNGYVAVPPTNRYHGKSWAEMDEYVDVHGGMTFSEPAYKPFTNEVEFITDNTEIGDDWWIFGFDTFHPYDNGQNWNRDAVIEETLRLKQQLEETNCCGNCRHFKDEDISGKVWCPVQKEEAHCGYSPCEEWEGKEETE